MRHLFCLLSALVLSMSVGRAAPPTDSTRRAESSRSVSGQIGTAGLGLFYNQVLPGSQRFALQLGGRYLAYRKPIRVKTAPDSYIQIDPDFMIGVAQANLKWHPFRRGSFFVVAGVGYTWHPDLNFVITAEDKLNLGGLELTPEDVGTVNLGFRWHPVVGYVGWGFGRTIPRKRLGVGFEMGMYYLGRPRVHLDYEGFLETTTIDEQVPVVEHNLSNYRYLPAINFTVSYTLGL